MKSTVPGLSPVAVAPQQRKSAVAGRGIHLVYSRERPFNPLPGLNEPLASRKELMARRESRRGRVSLALAAFAAPAMYGMHVLMVWLHAH